jgi:acyl-CoA synthetase (AMP-forming)/AMP-acid ligase II/thioesterase domain-containing protein/acyl carrier protein
MPALTAFAAAESTFFDVVAGHAERNPDQLALVALGFAPISYGDLLVQTDKIWDCLRDAGIKYGSQIGIALPSGPESAITTIAIAAHATCVPFNPRLSQSEFERELKRFNLDALIVPGRLDSAVRAAAESGSYGLFEASKARASLADFSLRCVRRPKHARASRGEVSSQSAVLLLRTSATTGPSKLVPVTHGNMVDLACKMSHWFSFTADDRAACVLPTYYAAGSKLNIVVPLLLGQTITLPAAARPERLAEWISELRPTWFSAGPTFLQAVLDDLRSSQEPPPKHDLRFITSGSAYLPNRVRSELESILGCPILEVYGISEAGVMAANPAPPAKRKPGTAGLIAEGELVIRGETGESLATGKIGEVFVGGPGLMPGYLGEAKPFGAGIQDGWLPTGDIGIVDSEGFLTILGRTKEVINRGGEKVSPAEIEEALMLHDCVREAAAFAVPHPRLGENVAAAVVLQPETTITPLGLRKFLRSRLAPFKIPQRIDIVESLPKSHTGKILRTELAESALHREHHIARAEHPLEFQIMDIWRRLLQRSDIGIHDDFFEAGGDSLLATQMLMEVEAAVGSRVPQSALAEASTIRQLATIAASGFGDEELVTKAKDGAGTPLFFCHGDFATRGFYALKLAALLDSNQPVYLIQPLRDVDDSSDLVMEDMARLHVPRLLELQPHGKFRLGGYCNGGLLAWEIAHQLIRAGREVESVVLVDSLSLNSRPVFRILRRFLNGVATVMPTKASKRYLLRDGMRISWNLARRSGGSKYGWMAEAIPPLYRRLVPRNDTTRPIESSFGRFGASHLRAMANYIPPKLDSEIIAISCEQHANVFEWSTEPWTQLAHKVQRSIVPGQHWSCITTHVESLARLLNAATANKGGA